MVLKTSLFVVISILFHKIFVLLMKAINYGTQFKLYIFHGL